jgi:soluble lytic murein transglycosylase
MRLFSLRLCHVVLKALIWVVLVMIPTFSHADDAQSIRAMMKFTETGKWTDAQASARAAGPLAQTIYEWFALQRDDGSYEFGRYRDFLAQYGDWPSIRRIRTHAEQGMTADLSSTAVLDFFARNDPVTARGMIMYVRALTSSGQNERAVEKIAKWFPQANLSNDEQAQFIKVLGDMVDDRVLMKRLDRLLVTENYGQARLLARTMGAGVIKLADARIALAKTARGAEHQLTMVPREYASDPGLIYERLRWRRKKDQYEGMASLILGLPKDFKPYDSRAFSSEQQIAVQSLMNNGEFVEAYQVAVHVTHDDRFAKAQADWQAGFVALVYLKQPGRAFRHFENLYKSSISPLSRARAAYWSGEASTALGYPDVARAWYRTASAYRSNFYGQLAATKIPSGSQPYRQGPPLASMSEQQEFARNPLVRAARLFHEAGNDRLTDLFLARIAGVYKGRGPMLRLAVDLANDLNLTTDAVKISREASMDGVDFSDYVFPTLAGLSFNGVEPALVYAIIRQESAFDVEAVSGSGALGLMQLMPRTAKAVAKQEGRKHKNDWLTERPEHNIMVGTAYLRILVRKYKSYGLVAAAYNAGEGRVDSWLKKYGDPRRGEIGLVEWIERIPLYETRNYAQRVLEGVHVYRRKTGANLAPDADPLHLAH